MRLIQFPFLNNKKTTFAHAFLNTSKTHMEKQSHAYINDLLNTSKYDNNLDDSEIGLPSVLIEAERRRKQMLEGPVPQFISSSETQKQRHEFFNQLTNLVNAKKQGVMV